MMSRPESGSTKLEILVHVNIIQLLNLLLLPRSRFKPPGAGSIQVAVGASSDVCPCAQTSEVMVMEGLTSNSGNVPGTQVQARG